MESQLDACRAELATAAQRERKLEAQLTALQSDHENHLRDMQSTLARERDARSDENRAATVKAATARAELDEQRRILADTRTDLLKVSQPRTHAESQPHHYTHD